MRQSDFEEYLQAFDHFFPEGGKKVNTPHLRWATLQEFIEDIKLKTKIDISSGDQKKIKQSQLVLATLISPEGNMPSKEVLETPPVGEKEAKRRESAKVSDAVVREAIEKKLEIYRERLAKIKASEEAFKDKEVFVKRREVSLSDAEQKAMEDLRTEVPTDPIAASKVFVPVIRERVDESIPDSVVALTALNIAVNLQTGSAPAAQAAVMAFVEKDPKKLGLIEYKELLSDPTKSLQELQDLTQKVAVSAFGENVGKVLIPDIDVSDTQQEDYIPTSTAFIPIKAQEIINSQVKVLEKGTVDPQIETKSFIERWQNEVAKGNFQQAAFKAVVVQESLTAFPQGPKSSWEAMGGDTKLHLSTGLADPINVIGGLAKVGAQKIGGKVATAVIAKTGLKAAVSKITTALSTLIPVPVVNWVVGLVGGEVLGRLLAKIPWHKIKKFGPYIVGALLFPFFGPIVAVAGGIGTALLGGATFAGLGTGALKFFLAVSYATIGAIGIPILIALFTLPVVIAFIIFIINTGAYVVPPSPLSAILGQDNPYMSVTKVASSDKIGNPSGQVTVTYTVTITATKSPLSNVQIVSSTCKATKKNNSQVGCPVENIPSIPSGTTVSPGSPYSFTFTVDYGSSLSDSIILDTIEVSADSPEQPGITTSGSETVCVGDCPTSCMQAVDTAGKWPGNLRANIEGAAATISASYPKFAARVCGAGEVTLCYAPSQISPGYFAWHKHTDACDVVFNQKGISSPGNALFLLTHEVTHHIQATDGSSVAQYRASGGYSEVSSSGFCTYSDTAGSITESMAESTGLYAAVPSWGSCVGNYRTRYPRNYNFAKGFME